MKKNDLSDVRSLVEDDFSRCSTVDKENMEELVGIAQMLKQMPDQDPPHDLVSKVLRSVEPKKNSLWTRLYQWLRMPRSIRIVPMKLIPAGAVVSAALLFALQILPRNEMIQHPKGEDPGKVTVAFNFVHPEAKSVSLIGSFNKWSPKGYQMKPRGEEKVWVWVIELNLPPGRYQYAYLVDGKVTTPDPKSPFSENDGFGNKNSVILVANSYEKKPL